MLKFNAVLELSVNIMLYFRKIFLRNVRSDLRLDTTERTLFYATLNLDQSRR